MKDSMGYSISLYRTVWYAEIGNIDPYGVGVWSKTLECHAFPTQAEAVSYLLHRTGIKQDKRRYHEFYTDNPCTMVRVREVQEQLTYEEERRVLHALMVL